MAVALSNRMWKACKVDGVSGAGQRWLDWMLRRGARALHSLGL